MKSDYYLGDISRMSYGKMPKKDKLNTGTFPTFSGYKYQHSYPEENCKKGDIIVVARGVGGTGDVKIVKENCYLTNLSIKIDLDLNIVNSEYFYYNYLLTNLRYLDSGSAQSQITINDLSNVLISLPSLATQKKIANILSTLDDKIELNRKMNQSLEEVAQALFKSWFIDFDPVHAKANASSGSNYEEIAKELGISREILDMFPDEFEESELGMIPKGWNLDRIGSVIIQKSENTKPSEYTQTHSYVPIDCIDSKCLALSTVKSGEEAKSSLIKFSRGDILFGAMRPYFHKVCIVPVDGTTRTTAFVLQSLKTDDYSFGVFSLYQDTTIKFATANSTGTTMPYVKWKGVLENMLIVLPSQTIRNEFNKICKPLLDTIQDRFAQQNTLQKTRDTLLPKLLSGELDVSELELDNVTH